MQAVETTEAVIQAISKQLGEGVTDEQVANVLTALNNVKTGEPVGTIRREPATGKVAHRVEAFGVQQWRVSGPDGEQYNDLQPTLPEWALIFDPTA
ncbi:hypothetical protein SEA_SOYO_34 [Mycobacterium phage SoYo]|uniref:Uncharacterized protein n=32 Tax=Microwolfvirus TaxID=2942894 RepID=A0A0A7S2L1_9CAUD|nr:hypothetical protein AVV34_gp66 [Mycobacterium phage MarQuardt]YP_009219095.1 hypothetical protein AVV42_gp69 [Mycobacterium phage Anubis]YP_009635624.1 hypothetical protein FGG58_gp61 [Mycobacterium phage JHC117]YP_009635709.1 hypothetical protein FGG61_gp61 [Mycobacterium phage Microwolf]AEK07696.1 hypothetical protein VIX_34 [Mycobacterium phage Vix]AIM51174.1 hypothetical protein PBI_FARBER_34 [Mycobacterium phage Farber]AJA43421.1 hypothetical protein PBI_TAURUS_34 [Mycobacterium phag